MAKKEINFMENNNIDKEIEEQSSAPCVGCLAKYHREASLMVATSALWAIAEHLDFYEQQGHHATPSELLMVAEAVAKLSSI